MKCVRITASRSTQIKLRKRTLPGLIPIVFFGKELESTNKVKYLGVVLDSKLTWSEHLDQKCKKATALFWQCRRIVGSTWGTSPKIYHWIYIAIIRPMITHAAVVWWPGVELWVARVMLSSSEISMPSNNRGNLHLTYCSFGSNNWLIAPRYSYQASGNDYQLKNWKCVQNLGSHSHILEKMHKKVPFTGMRGDHMKTCFLFDLK